MAELAIACCAPLDAPVLTDAEAEATAELFRALGDPARVRIVNLIATSGGPVCVCDLVDPLGLAQPTVSHHMRRLLEAGLLVREQRGRCAYYSLEPEAARKLAAVTEMKGACC
jgi:ArsR family transcriptional regulator, arsenate/arsenite/antimonite-responsive transcriptional repressor